jgi:hypothetical protein
MKKKTQISPIISQPALHESRDVIVPQRLVVTRESGGAILKQMRSGKATKALRDLMRDGD